MNKIKIIILGVFVFCMCGLGIIKALDKDLKLLGKVIYLDPGHGGIDPGAIYKNINEKDINLSISLKLQKKLESLGAIVYLTRYADYDLAVPNALNRKRSDLSRRANIINKSLCDLYLSIHLNADVSTIWYGAQVFYDDVNKENIEIAKIMQDIFKKRLKTNRKYEEMKTMYLHKRVERPGILIEVGFITNPNERYLLKSDNYQMKIVNIISEGIDLYLN